MKITKVETLCLSRLHELERQWFTARYRTIKADCAIVIIDTDAGLQGIGEACAYGWPHLIREWVDWMAKTIIKQARNITDAFFMFFLGFDCFDPTTWKYLPGPWLRPDTCPRWLPLSSGTWNRH